MRQAYLYSAALHLAVFMVAYLGVPALFTTPPVKDVPVTVDLVSLEEVIKPKKAPKPPKKAPPPKPVEAPPPPPAAPPEPPKPVAAPIPEPPPPEAKPEPVPEPKPKPQAKPKPVPVPKAKPVPKAAPKPPTRPVQAAPKPKPKPPEVDQFTSILKNLAKQQEERARRQESEPEPDEAVKQPSPKPFALSAISQQMQAQRLTAMVREQLKDCWSIPAGVKDAHKIKVAVLIQLNPDGSLRRPPRVIDDSRMSTDQSFRVIAESAVRALQNPRCHPLKLPYDQYDLWKDITFNFDPSEALGQ